ncbi:MiaB/RimO family radical SAM methylthiotransferase [Patescibacteria group bacterium]|nr:MiaB/RimO family radical SAM methylthiotransferase [Patescibacteria group bacterium]
MNKSDSERIAGKLEELGYKRSDNKYQADLVVINTCGVRQTAEDRIYGFIPEIKKKNFNVKIIVTGCLVYRKDVQKRLKKWVDAWIPINQIFKFRFSIFNKFLNSDFQINVKCTNDYLKIIPKYESKFSAFVPIGNGCNNFCSYCVVPYARGREVYRPAEDILKEIKGLIKKKYKEIILIAQNVNSYEVSRKSIKSKVKSQKPEEIIKFHDLLKMINDIKGDFQIQFLTSHPKDMSDKLIKTIAKSKKVCHYIHLPIQAGDNEILKKMNRKYTVEYYINLIKKIRKAMPDSNITTDIIVGFPGETKKQFQNTVNICKKINFNKAYISVYSPRPGTAAAKLKDSIPILEKKQRWKILNELINKNEKK